MPGSSSEPDHADTRMPRIPLTSPTRAILIATALFAMVLSFCLRADFGAPVLEAAPTPQLTAQSPATEEAKSAGCVTCHTDTDEPSMHPGGNVKIGCADCHGGDPAVAVTP